MKKTARYGAVYATIQIDKLPTETLSTTESTGNEKKSVPSVVLSVSVV